MKEYKSIVAGYPDFDRLLNEHIQLGWIIEYHQVHIVGSGYMRYSVHSALLSR